MTRYIIFEIKSDRTDRNKAIEIPWTYYNSCRFGEQEIYS